MIRTYTRRYKAFVLISVSLGLVACGTARGPEFGYQQRAQPGAGQYVYPQNLRPQPLARTPANDQCNALMFRPLIGRHEGSIHFPSLPGRTRVIKPAFLGYDLEGEPVRGLDPQSPFVEVRDFIAGQVLYAPSVGSPTRRESLGPIIGDRLTIELSEDGTVQDVACR